MDPRHLNYFPIIDLYLSVSCRHKVRYVHIAFLKHVDHCRDDSLFPVILLWKIYHFHCEYLL